MSCALDGFTLFPKKSKIDASGHNVPRLLLPHLILKFTDQICSGEKMKPFRLITVSLMLLVIAPVAKATFMLNVKVGQTVGNQIIEFNKSFQADYNEEIVISSESLKNKIVLNLKKIDDVLVNGNKISPIQVDMKLLNEMQRIIGRPQTVTSFYKRSAEFEVHSSGISSDAADLNVSINFEEPN